jgi:hypothetical protein
MTNHAPNPIPAAGEAMSGAEPIDLVDTLSCVNALIEAACMAAGRLSKEEGDAIQSVLDVAQDKLKLVINALRGAADVDEPRGATSDLLAERRRFEQLYSKWLNARAAETDRVKHRNNEVQNELTDDVENAARLLLATPIPLNRMIWWKWEVLEGWADGSPANWTDNRVGFALGCIKADLQRVDEIGQG